MVVQNFYIYKLCWLNLQGSITFPPQQMPHASTDIKIAPLECWGEKLQRRCARWRRWRWVGLDADGGIGAEKVYSRLKAHSMICNCNKNAPDNNTLHCRAYSSNIECKALWISADKQVMAQNMY
jgi:hypothetical protein